MVNELHALFRGRRDKKNIGEVTKCAPKFTAGEMEFLILLVMKLLHSLPQALR